MEGGQTPVRKELRGELWEQRLTAGQIHRRICGSARGQSSSKHAGKIVPLRPIKRRTKKKIPFLATGGQRNYLTYICLSVTEKKPFRVSITKVKQFYGQSDFVKRSQWTIDQLQQVNGIDSSKDCPEFDLSFDNTVDQWAASSAGDKCTFIQVLHYTCQRYCLEKKPEFVNCQAKLLGESREVESVFFRCKVYLNRMKKEFMSRHGHLLRQGKP
ncbi:hypothetical protein OJAV_G00215970 [Oryzias javanicus]|uniref:Exocyst complex component Sec3 PIP2-binding N-terminal domain-containing protein n=1 Tax=Oryzias javanicus TaxID=123683 RepID=A0A437C407_ORYJA|nr:hypothetical protein OJAV_G00215970 [Oryzias javanicus]